MVACFSNSMGVQSKGFLEETMVDLSQAKGFFSAPGSFLLLIQTISFEFKLRQFFLTQTTLVDGVSSLQPFFFASVWPEREICEMFGVPFHTSEEFDLDLRRLLTDYGFSGFPLQKGYPVVGYSELRYDPSLNRIVEEPLSLDQIYPFRKDWFAWSLPKQTGVGFGLLNPCHSELISIF